MSNHAEGPPDVERMWPDLFAPLDRSQRRAVLQAIANQYLEGWEPGREEVADLAGYVTGTLAESEYDARARERARRRAAEHG